MNENQIFVEANADEYEAFRKAVELDEWMARFYEAVEKKVAELEAAKMEALLQFFGA